VRSEGNMSLKNPVTPPGIDSGTVLENIQVAITQRSRKYLCPELLSADEYESI
jgi:hypothetical protein